MHTYIHSYIHRFCKAQAVIIGRTFSQNPRKREKSHQKIDMIMLDYYGMSHLVFVFRLSLLN